MNTLRIAICEDEDREADRLRALINTSSVPTEVSRFESGEAFLAFLAGHPASRFDLVFFDIYMGGVLGVEAARVLRETDDACGVVFTTNSPDHMPEAFDVGADQYLLKPVEHEKLAKVLKKRLALMERSQKSCIVNAKGQSIDVLLDHIYYVEVINHNCRVHTANGVIETGSVMKLEDFARQLPPPRFVRCHKSYIVNMSYVDKIDRDFIMKNGDRVYIRRGDVALYARELDKWLLSEIGRDEI